MPLLFKSGVAATLLDVSITRLFQQAHSQQFSLGAFSHSPQRCTGPGNQPSSTTIKPHRAADAQL